MQKKINLYVDDLRDCPEGFVIARTYEEAIYYLENYEVEILSLDHDLGENEETKELLPTGDDLVLYMTEHSLYGNKIYLHTDNPVGRSRMLSGLQAAQRRGFIPDYVEIYHYSITANKYTHKETD